MKINAPKFFHLIIVASLLFTFPTAGLQARVSETPPQQTDQAGTAFDQGKRLLRRGHADLALVQLQNALNLYTAAKNERGIAKVHNELGDLYLRQGQFQVALDHYKKALDGFIGEDKKNQ